MSFRGDGLASRTYTLAAARAPSLRSRAHIRHCVCGVPPSACRRERRVTGRGSNADGWVKRNVAVPVMSPSPFQDFYRAMQAPLESLGRSRGVCRDVGAAGLGLGTPNNRSRRAALAGRLSLRFGTVFPRAAVAPASVAPLRSTAGGGAAGAGRGAAGAARQHRVRRAGGRVVSILPIQMRCGCRGTSSWCTKCSSSSVCSSRPRGAK